MKKITTPQESTKYKIARIVNSCNSPQETPTYEDLLKDIYENMYRTILKIPISVFILGTIDSFIVKDLSQANKILKIIKEVVQDSFEVSGYELTFVDKDWTELIIIETPSQYGAKYALSKNDESEGKSVSKNYMSEFFII